MPFVCLLPKVMDELVATSRLFINWDLTFLLQINILTCLTHYYSLQSTHISHPL